MQKTYPTTNNNNSKPLRKILNIKKITLYNLWHKDKITKEKNKISPFTANSFTASTSTGREHCEPKKGRPKERAVNFTVNLYANQNNFYKVAPMKLKDIKGERHIRPTEQKSTCGIAPTEYST